MRDIHCPKDIGFENTFSGEDCGKEQYYNNCYHCWSTAIAKQKTHWTMPVQEENDTVDYTIKKIYDQIEEFIQKQNEYTEKTLTEIITNYDFIVGSKECKDMLMEILPEGASIVCSPFIASPTMIYAIKKFDAMDFIRGTLEERKDREEKA